MSSDKEIHGNDSPGDQLRSASRNEFVEKSGETWTELKSLTAARIALGRSGASQPTSAMLSFQLDHSRARDAIHSSMDATGLQDDLQKIGLHCLKLSSEAGHRSLYLKRPDLGRKLNYASKQSLKDHLELEKAPTDSGFRFDIVFVIADGLSARAVQDHSVSFISAFQNLLQNEKKDLRIGPVCIVEQGRVAIGDPVGEILNSALVAVLIGERPGLSSPDSMGLYMTYAPRSGTTDERRNCISNIRPEGLQIQDAVRRFFYLATQSMNRALSGVFLKDDSGPALDTTTSNE